MITNLWRIETPEKGNLIMTARSKKVTHPKDNAKGRRKKENKELSDLASQLPLPVTVATQLDKASVVRLSTAYLKLRRLFPRGLGKGWGEDSSVAEDMLPELGKFLNKSFHGFVFILGADATILYISEEASAQLGFSQVQLTGKCFWSYVHSHDAKELKSVLCFDMDIPAFNVGNPLVDDVEVPRSFTVRMKCILPKRQAELAVDRYKVIHCRGYLKLKRKTKHWEGMSSVCYEMTGVVASGHSLSPAPSAEIKLYRQDFMFRTGLNLQLSYIDPRSQKITGYEPTQLQDKSLYKFIHPYDCKQMKQVHEIALTKSQAISSYYRFLTQNGGWIWIQSSCIVITSNKTDQGQCILFTNSVLSEREYPNCTFAIEQVATHENKLCTSLKRPRTSLKSRKKAPSHIQENPSPSDQNSMSASPNGTLDIQGLMEVPFFGSNNIHYLNHMPEFIQKSNLWGSLQAAELHSDKYASLSGSFEESGLNECASLSYLEPVKDAINFRQENNTEFNTSNNIMHNSSSELDDSGIAFHNLIVESSRMPSTLNSKNEHVICDTAIMNDNDSDLEHYKFLNPCINITSVKDNQTFKPSHNNLTSSLLPFTNFSIHSPKSNQGFIIHDCNFDSKFQVSDSVFALDKSSLKPNVGGDKFPVSSCNSSSTKNNETDCINDSDITTSVRMKNCNILTTNRHAIHGDRLPSQEKVLLSKESIDENSADGIRYCKNSFETTPEPEMHESNQTSDHKNCNISKTFVNLLPEKMRCDSSITAYNFCNSPSNQTFSGITMNEDKFSGQFEVFSKNCSAISSKKIFDEENDSLLTICANIANHDYDQCFKKSRDLSNKFISDNEWTPVLVPTVDQFIIRTDDANIFYNLNHLNNDAIPYTNYVTTESTIFPATVKDNIISHINNMSPPIETASPSIAVVDSSNELCTSSNFNLDTNPEISTQPSSSIINLDQSGKSTSLHSSNNDSSISNILRVSTESSTHECTTNEYLCDQWTTMYSQRATNVRSDSACSTSLGYSSESSYVGQSSPFSTYGESSFL